MVVSPDWLTLFFFPCLKYLNNTQKEKSRKVMSSSGIKFRKVQERNYSAIASCRWVHLISVNLEALFPIFSLNPNPPLGRTRLCDLRAQFQMSVTQAPSPNPSRMSFSVGCLQAVVHLFVPIYSPFHKDEV
jgi:hypothetical protein